MTLPPLAPAAAAPAGRARGRLVRQPVLAVLLAGVLAALLGGPFLSVAPNRLVSGQGVALRALLSGAWWWLLAPLALWAWAVVRPPRRVLGLATAMAAAALLVGLVAVAGAAAARLSADLPALARVSLAGGFWVSVLLVWAAYTDALARAASGRGWHALAHGLVLLCLAALLHGGTLDALSLLKEYASRHEVVRDALWRHLQIVGASLAAAVLVGGPLGLAAARRPGPARPWLAALGVVQTLPSVALFGLLIAPLAWLGQAWPGSGVQGVGVVPAVLALTLYALLPVALGVMGGLQQVPASAWDAAAGMGMSARQRLRQVALPLALPALLSALRLTAVQLVGLTVVAALIGAGGLGAIIFQGLLSGALDRVLLGVLPVVALALLVDRGFALLTRAAARRGQGA